jgi:putative hydrolase of the HAD superfamily
MSPSRVEVPPGAGLVLDLDDTLYPERAFHESGFRWIAGRLGIDPAGPEVAAAGRELRRPGGRPLDVLAEASGVPVATLLEWHRAHPPTISLYPDAARLLERAARAGLPLVLLTDGRSVTQRNKIEALGVARAFRTILVSEETGVDKLGLEAFRGAQEQLADCTTVVSIGDNPRKDQRGPRLLGWEPVLVLDRPDRVHPAGPGVPVLPGCRVIRDLDEVAFTDRRVAP